MRFYLPRELWAEGTLGPEESHHLSTVLRVQPGTIITLFDGEGREAQALVLSCSKASCSMRIGSISHTSPPSPHLTLACAIPKGKAMDLIVQKAVELGVNSLQPLVTARTIVAARQEKAEKWRRTALEACKQCGQNHLPEVAEPLGFGDWLEACSETKQDRLFLLASLSRQARPLREVLAQCPHPPQRIVVAIGPEGDFTPEETAAALGASFLPVSLGPLTLRVETAALYSIVAIRYQYT